jgi:hypothetical protein
MNRDTLDFIDTMKARGVIRFAPPVPVEAVSREAKNATERERAERKRRARGCRVYAQSFNGKLPARSDASYQAVYMRLARAAGKWKGTK